MVLIRSLIYFVLLSLSTVLFSLLLVLIGWALPFRLRGVLLLNAWGRVNLWLLAAICGLRYQIEGWEHLPQGNAIVLAKHQSAWETIALRGLLPPEQTWVLKRELLWVPFFGWGLALAQPIAIDRTATKKAMRQVITEGTRRLGQGRWVIIFPEGTRVAPGSHKKYGVGGALLAAKSGYPVVPIAHNAGVFWRRRGLMKYPGTIRVVIGEPIDVGGLDTHEINRRVEEWIEARVAELPQHNGAD